MVALRMPMNRSVYYDREMGRQKIFEKHHLSIGMHQLNEKPQDWTKPVQLC